MSPPREGRGGNPPRGGGGPDPCWWHSHRKASEAVALLLGSAGAPDEDGEDEEDGDAQRRQRQQRSIKSLTLANGVRNKPYVHLLVCETLRCMPALRAIHGAVVAGTQQPHRQHHQPHQRKQGRKRPRAEVGGGGAGAGFRGAPAALTMVLLYALLFFRGGLKPVGREEKAMLKRKNAYKAALARLMVSHGVDSVDVLCPRIDIDEGAEESGGVGGAGAELKTVRVNTLLVGVEEAVRELDVLRSERIASGAGAGAAAVVVDSVTTDEYVRGVFHVRGRRRVAGLHAHEGVASGKLVIQSWSSCLPAAALAPGRGWRVIDACAAPGNKTTQLAAMVGGGGRVYAFDRSSARVETLRRTLARMGAAEIVRAEQRDFLSTDPGEYSDVRAMLLDPSCSGSGTMHKRGDILIRRATLPLSPPGAAGAHAELRAPTDPSQFVSAERVAALAAVQLRLLLHALSFPSLERLVYSTCSVFREENEAVVEAALEFATRRGWSIGHPFAAWHRRGAAAPGGDVPWLRRVVRVDPFLGDRSDGFFLCLFVRDGAGGGGAGAGDNQRDAPPPPPPGSDTGKAKRRRKKKKMKRAKDAAMRGSLSPLS